MWFFINIELNITKMRTQVFIFVIISTFNLARTQVPSYGYCPDISVEEDFDLERYMGKWYEYARYPFVYEVARKCNSVHYDKDDRKSFTISNKSVDR